MKTYYCKNCDHNCYKLNVVMGVKIMTREEDLEQAVEDINTIIFNFKPDEEELKEIIFSIKEEAGL